MSVARERALTHVVRLDSLWGRQKGRNECCP